MHVHAHKHMYTHKHMHTCTYILRDIHMHVCAHVQIHVYPSMHVCTYNTCSMQTCKCLYKHAHVCDYINAHRHLHTHRAHSPSSSYCEDTGSQHSERATQGSQRRQALPWDARSTETLLPAPGWSLSPPEISLRAHSKSASALWGVCTTGACCGDVCAMRGARHREGPWALCAP